LQFRLFLYGTIFDIDNNMKKDEIFELAKKTGLLPVVVHHEGKNYQVVRTYDQLMAMIEDGVDFEILKPETGEE